MKIPEYTQRITTDYTPTAKVRITEPEIFSDLSNVKRNQEKLFKTAEGLSDTYLSMKKRRDEGISNEFMLRFAEAEGQWLRENKDKFKGANAQGIVDAYSQWQEEYFGTRKGFSQSLPEGELYLENQEQIDFVQDQMRRKAVNTINSLSSYAAGELETYTNNQLSARVDLLVDDISNESDMNNITNDVEVLSEVIAQRYVGQSPEYLEVMTKKFVGSAIETNISNNMLTDPVLSIEKLQNDFFTGNLNEKTVGLLESNAVKSYIEKESDNIANAMLQGYSGNDIVDVKSWNKVLPTIEKYNVDTVKREILSKAAKKANLKKADKKVDDDNIVNNATIDVFKNLSIKNNSAYSSEDRADASQNLIAGLQQLGMSENGTAIANFIIGTDTDYKSSVYALEEKKRMVSDLTKLKNFRPDVWAEGDEKKITELTNSIDEEQTRINNEAPLVGKYLQIINDNGYSDLQSIIGSFGGLNKLHPINRAAVLDEFVTSLEFDKLAKEWQGKKSTTIYDKMKKMFKEVSSVNAEDNPYAFNIFKKQMRDSLLGAKKAGQDINANMSRYARDAYLSTQTQGGDVANALYQISYSIPQIRKEAKLAGGEGMVNTYTVMQSVKTALGEKNSPFADFSDDEKNNLADMMIGGDSVAALSYAQSVLSMYKDADLRKRELEANEPSLWDKTVTVGGDLFEWLTDKARTGTGGAQMDILTGDLINAE